MPTAFSEAQLLQLQTGDRIRYGGVYWQVKGANTYQDTRGYETQEWTLQYAGGKQHYLLREFDPDNPDSHVNWYISEEFYGQIGDPVAGTNLRPELWRAMWDDREPYPQLHALGRDYAFLSQTVGTYAGEEESEQRRTWDYWDADRLWNLALEAWQGGELHTYSTKKVNPEDFSDLQRKSRVVSWQWIAAWALTVLGIYLMLFGGW